MNETEKKVNISERMDKAAENILSFISPAQAAVYRREMDLFNKFRKAKEFIATAREALDELEEQLDFLKDEVRKELSHG